jgi:hypothetical protein
MEGGFGGKQSGHNSWKTLSAFKKKKIGHINVINIIHTVKLHEKFI